MSLSEILRSHLAELQAWEDMPSEREIREIPHLDADDITRLSTISSFESTILEKHLSKARLTEGLIWLITRLVKEVSQVDIHGQAYHVTVGDIRGMTDEQLTLLSEPPRGAQILRQLFGREGDSHQ